MGPLWSRLGRAVLLAGAAGGVSFAQTWTEGFDDVSALADSGWLILNHSSPNPENSTSVFQGNFHRGLENPPPVFAAESGDVNAYAAMNYNSTSSGGTISTWLISPVFQFGDGDYLSFFTRTVSQPQFPDRLEVRVSYAGESSDIGLGADEVGDFSTLLLTVNEELTTTGYPAEWTSFATTLSGVGGSSGRIAFRYWVPDGGQTGSNSDYIGIDTFEFSHSLANSGGINTEVPEVSTWAAGAFASFLATYGFLRRRR